MGTLFSGEHLRISGPVRVGPRAGAWFTGHDDPRAVLVPSLLRGPNDRHWTVLCHGPDNPKFHRNIIVGTPYAGWWISRDRGVSLDQSHLSSREESENQRKTM